MESKLHELGRKLIKPKGQDCTRGSSRSSPKGRIACSCPECHSNLIIKQVDRFNTQTECSGCGLIDNSGFQTLSQSGIHRIR